VAARHEGKLSDKKQLQLTPESSKSAKVGKQSEEKVVVGMKRSLESDSDEEDDDDEEEDDGDDDDDVDLSPIKKKPFVAEGILHTFNACFLTVKKLFRTNIFLELKAWFCLLLIVCHCGKSFG